MKNMYMFSKEERRKIYLDAYNLILIDRPKYTCIGLVMSGCFSCDVSLLERSFPEFLLFIKDDTINFESVSKEQCLIAILLCTEMCK